MRFYKMKEGELDKKILSEVEDVKGVESRLEKRALSEVRDVEKLIIGDLLPEIHRLRNLISIDELTGLLNRKGLQNEFKQIFNELRFLEKQKGKRRLKIDDLAVLFVDCDNFKRINDTYGHAVGDSVLRLLAQALRSHVRSIDVVGRYGGEEFVVALLDANEKEGYKKAEIIRKYFEKKVKIHGHSDFKLTVSIGVSSYKKSNAKTAKELIDEADKAMYEAKTNRGKNNTVCFSELKSKK